MKTKTNTKTIQTNTRVAASFTKKGVILVTWYFAVAYVAAGLAIIHGCNLLLQANQ